MHICLITSGRPFEVLYGGEEKFTISLGSWLLNQGLNVTIGGRKRFGVTIKKFCDNVHAEVKINSRPAHVLRLPYPLYILCMLIISLFLTLQIVTMNRRSKIHIIHAQDTGYGGLSAVMSAKILRVPVIISSHGVRYITLSKAVKGISQKISLPFEYWLDLITIKSADLIITVSRSVEGYFARLGMKKDKLKTIPVGIKISDFKIREEVRQALRGELGVQNYFAIGFVGRFAVEKNLFTLLEAFIQVSKHCDKMKLILIGAGPLEKELKKLSHDIGINNKIIFTGIRSDVNRLLSALDVFILPSYVEGCPTVLIEAMASGKAIIASDIPAIREIVKDGEEALLFDPHNFQQLKNLILTLYNSPELRAKLGENARRKAKEYDINVVFPKILQIYKWVLTSSAKSK